MKRTVWLWEFFGFATASVLGTILHFLYDLLGGAVWIAPFSSINESTFEHMKLLFWPMLFYTVIQSFFFKGYKSFLCVKLKGTLVGISLIPLIFYTYNGVIGKSPGFINITIFFVSAAVAYIYETRKLNDNGSECKHPKLALLTLLLIGAAFVIFTFKTPGIAIFKDPVSAFRLVLQTH